MKTELQNYVPKQPGTESFRGRNISNTFINKFKKSLFYTTYISHPKEIILGVRDGYISLYYNCDSIAKINCNTEKLQATINEYYTPNGKSILIDREFKDYYDKIKENSDLRLTPEKKAQAQLIINNNLNIDSKWFCIDLEYTKTYGGARSDWRFDIIAISKKAPHKVALIELKYGSAAIGGQSGIRSHIKDFHNFFKNGSSFDILKPELLSMIKAQSSLGVAIPGCLKTAKITDFESSPSFYILTLDNNPHGDPNTATPKMSISGYLFSDRRWGCRRISSDVRKYGDYFSITGNDSEFTTHFLFSNARLPELGINDILNSDKYCEEIIHMP